LHVYTTKRSNMLLNITAQAQPVPSNTLIFVQAVPRGEYIILNVEC